MQEVQGKTAFITGGASGIGLGMAKVFARAGMRIVIADIRSDHLEEAHEALVSEFGSEGIHTLQLDVTDREAFAVAAQAAEARFGNIHILCNNAGIGILKSVETAEFADWDWAVDVNLHGVFNGVKIFLPHILGHGEGGHIVNTASMAGILQYSRAALYVATKFAVVGLTEALRAELESRNIGVSAFCPGGVRSNIREYEKTRPDRFAVNHDDASPSQPPQFSFSDADRERLGRLTASPEEAGEMVLQGIRTNALYIFTAPEFRPGVEERFDAIRRALGHDAQRERDALELIPGLVSSPIYRDA